MGVKEEPGNSLFIHKCFITGLNAPDRPGRKSKQASDAASDSGLNISYGAEPEGGLTLTGDIHIPDKVTGHGDVWGYIGRYPSREDPPLWGCPGILNSEAFQYEVHGLKLVSVARKLLILSDVYRREGTLGARRSVGLPGRTSSSPGASPHSHHCESMRKYVLTV